MGNKFIKLLKEIEPITDERNAIPLQENSYEVLEFLGDAVIHSVIAEYLFRRYPEKDQGFLTKLRTKIEKGETLNKFSRKLNFDENYDLSTETCYIFYNLIFFSIGTCYNKMDRISTEIRKETVTERQRVGFKPWISRLVAHRVTILATKLRQKKQLN